MPFHHREFLLFFLPVLMVLFALSREKRLLCLCGLSLIYLMLGGLRDFTLICVSFALNYVAAHLMKRTEHPWLLPLVILANLAGLVWAKLSLPSLGAIPLGISFYTFEQIAFHIDCKRKKTSIPNFLSYIFFVSYLPHLVAGPLIRCQELLKQVETPQWNRLPLNLSTANIALLIIGISKKVLIADQLSPLVTMAYRDASLGNSPIGVLHFTLATFGFGAEIYFDFSAYSDIALATSAIFGIQLPQNFASPFKSTSIRDFWQRWHMSLGSFISDYLYRPIATRISNRTLRVLWIIPVMGFIGLWHGISWPFLVWGCAQGAALCLHRVWKEKIQMPAALGFLFTNLFVFLGCLLFRNVDFSIAARLLAAAFNFTIGDLARSLNTSVALLSLSFILIYFFPNSNTIHQRLENEAINSTSRRLALNSVLFVLAIASLLLSDFESSFVYFRF